MYYGSGKWVRFTTPKFEGKTLRETKKHLAQSSLSSPLNVREGTLPIYIPHMELREDL